MKKPITTAAIPCKQCPNNYEPDYTNLGSTGQPILCKCKLKYTMVFYNIVEPKCPIR